MPKKSDAMLDLVMSMYIGETCQYCRQKFSILADLESAVWDHPNEFGRVAHSDCFKAHGNAKEE